jgi:hypothetical protein
MIFACSSNYSKEIFVGTSEMITREEFNLTENSLAMGFDAIPKMRPSVRKNFFIQYLSSSG